MLREIKVLPIHSEARPSRRHEVLSLRNSNIHFPNHCLETRIESAFAKTGYQELQDILVIGRDSKVTLWGTVSTRFLQQLALEVANHQPGVRRVVNAVHVASDR